MAANFKDLKIYQLALELSVEVHKMTLTLPKFELYEEGSQIRRSSKSISSNIVEGFGRREYKAEYLRYITFSIAECDETKHHLTLLFKTGSLKDEKLYKHLYDSYEELGKKLYRFYEAVQNKHLSLK